MATRFYGVSIIGIVLTDKDLRVSDETSGETAQTTNITHVLIHTLPMGFSKQAKWMVSLDGFGKTQQAF